jgi:hypothetical protein
MKLLVLLLCLSVLPVLGLAQVVDSRINDKDGFMREVITLEGKSQKEIQASVIRWVKTNYNNPSEVILVQDSDLVKIREIPEIAPVVQCRVSTEWEIKDGKVRLTMNEYDCKSQYANFNALVGMRKDNGTVKLGWSAHLTWVVDSFDRKVKGLKEILKQAQAKDDW